MKTVPEMFEEASDTFRERQKIYGKSYLKFGKIMVGFFPNGLEIKTEDDWRRLNNFIQIAGKMTRYSEAFSSGGHDDSMLDASVYSMIQREIDSTARENKENEERVHLRHRDDRSNKKRTNAVKPAA